MSDEVWEVEQRKKRLKEKCGAVSFIYFWDHLTGAWRLNGVVVRVIYNLPKIPVREGWGSVLIKRRVATLRKTSANQLCNATSSYL